MRSMAIGGDKELMGEHCIQEVLERFMEMMASKVILEEEIGFPTGDKEENTVVDTNGRIGKQPRVWKEKHLLEHSKAMRGKDGVETWRVLYLKLRDLNSVLWVMRVGVC